MFILTGILGIIGVVIFCALVVFHNNLLENNESGLVHLLMTFMYICWIPIPIGIVIKFKFSEILFLGTIFGVLGLGIMIISMIMQTGHLTYSSKMNIDYDLWKRNDMWILEGLLGSSVEMLGLFLKSVWVICLSIVFFMNKNYIMSFIGVIYGMSAILYFLELLDMSMVRKPKCFEKLPKNLILITNIETASWFLIISIWIVS